MYYLIKPVREERLVPTLEMALGAIKVMLSCEKMAELEQPLEDRKISFKGTGINGTIFYIWKWKRKSDPHFQV